MCIRDSIYRAEPQTSSPETSACDETRERSASCDETSKRSASEERTVKCVYPAACSAVSGMALRLQLSRNGLVDTLKEALGELKDGGERLKRTEFRRLRSLCAAMKTREKWSRRVVSKWHRRAGSCTSFVEA
eukprot:TRINITY_DN1726_c0_g1_i3.p1 TRINITY_DN1726_c0_g1~~TRINITY_DN1726_c0_g1_i3.p1  ORF type:complete len:132 (-),score=17.80 TRINITY_DN1726_c0_g1_i3:18-413(-)